MFKKILQSPLTWFALIIGSALAYFGYSLWKSSQLAATTATQVTNSTSGINNLAQTADNLLKNLGA